MQDIRFFLFQHFLQASICLSAIAGGKILRPFLFDIRKSCQNSALKLADARGMYGGNASASYNCCFHNCTFCLSALFFHSFTLEP